MSSTFKLFSYMTMISNFFVFNEFFTYPTRVTKLKMFFCFSHNLIFVEMFFHYFFTVFTLFKNCFNKFISSIFTSVKNNWFMKFIINTNKFMSETTRNVILIFFLARIFIIFQTTFKVSKNFEWSSYLFKIIFKLNFSFF